MAISLVATDGRESSAGALRLAEQWSSQSHGDIELVIVGDIGLSRRVQSLLDDVFATPPHWPHTIVSGDVASAVALVSAARNASLVIMGAGGPSDRHITVETARRATVPILAVPARVRSLPRHAVLAVDFSTSSVRAAKVALPLLARPSRAQMVAIGESGPHIELLLDAIEDTLGRPEHVEFDRYSARGEPVTEILRYTATRNADLIAVGRCGRSPKTCNTPGALGRVAQALISTAPCSVLLA
jgi:nucleotide-binding universal stress UspA family protein